MDVDNKTKDNQKEEVPYKRSKLIILPESENKVLNLEQSKLLYDKFGMDKIKEFSIVNLSHLYFYHYKCESVNDTNWGCAWRSMQTVLKYQLSLSNQNKDISFYNLFMKYGDKNTLIDIYKKMKNGQDVSEVLNILKNKEFAPFETESGWAEPFISQLALYDFGFEGDLILLNGYFSHNYAPEEVFKEKLIFKEFAEKLKAHFMNKNPAPIIIDDSFVSLCIIGIKFNEENKNIELLIMDPHGVEKFEEGLYIVVLNEEGELLKELPKPALASISLTFKTKYWMIYFPKQIKSINN